MIHIETDYNTGKTNTVFIVSDYYKDNTLTVWGFDDIKTALGCKTKSDVGMWRIKQQKLNH